MSDHYAFSRHYPSLARSLVTEARICKQFSGNPEESLTIRAVWDTGATSTVISPDAAGKINLVSIDKLSVYGVNSYTEVDVSIVSIILPNGIVLKNNRITICKLPPTVDMLIGMDIILMGDLFICNADNRTLFSYAFPPYTA
ncbi:MAG: retropepsin-like domain-containing protein [Treponema sp.]|jgi:predicted aspartyl protease|nr:retropepsin-like domain-containing protein [Treponema sp.]